MNLIFHWEGKVVSDLEDKKGPAATPSLGTNLAESRINPECREGKQENAPPVLLVPCWAIPRGYVVVRCPVCGRAHYHGSPFVPPLGGTRRVAHCLRGVEYDLQLADDPAPVDLLQEIGLLPRRRSA